MTHCYIVQPCFSAILRCFKWTTRRGSRWLRLQTEWVWRMWVLAQTNRLRNWQLSTLALCSILNAAGWLHTARSPLSPVFSCVYYAYTMTLACVCVFTGAYYLPYYLFLIILLWLWWWVALQFSEFFKNVVILSDWKASKSNMNLSH